MVCIFLGAAATTPAKADVGVHPILPGGSSIQPEEQTPIQMTAEVVEMHVRLAKAADNTLIILNPDAYGYQFQDIWFPAVAEVQADFTMRNPTNEAVNLTTWFPLASTLRNISWELNPDEIVPRIADFQVNVDGTPLDYTVSELPNPKGADKPPLPWASFPITFSAGKDTMIHVSYVLPLHQLPKSNALALYYIFQTGAGWAGPIGQAELILNLPYPASAETLAGMPSGSLNPPYFIYLGEAAASIPPGGVLEGNQARWTWTNLEPGPQDDFAILLLHPKSWNELRAMRDAVKTWPNDGQAWLKLCTSYYNRSHNWRGVIPMGYSLTYQAMGVEACQEAARLLPGDAAPHYLLAGFYLSALRKNPSMDTLQPVWVELKIGQKFETIQPPSDVAMNDCWDYSSYSECLEAVIANTYAATPRPEWDASVKEYLTNAAESIAQNATTTAEWIAQSTAWAEQTASAAVRETPFPTPTQKPSLTPIPATLTPSPLPPTPLPTPTPIQAIGNEQSFILPVAAGVVGLIIAGYLVLKRLRRSQ